jgi:hypothetical protein
VLLIEYAFLSDFDIEKLVMSKNTQFDLSQISQLLGIDIITNATPFFWKSVRECFEAVNDSKSIDSGNRARYHLIMNAFDSFFDYLPDGSSFRFSISNDYQNLLPRTGIRIPNLQGNEATIIRNSSTIVEIDTARNESFILDLKEAHDHKLTLKLVGSKFRNIRILYSADPMSFEFDNKIDELPNQAWEFVQNISKSLDLIETVDKSLHKRISNELKWIVQIPQPLDETLLSSTSKNLDDTIFISSCSDDICLSELIIHEFAHLELNMLMRGTKLIAKSDGSLYYSPWKDKPRPLSALLHAVYSFSTVLDFYQKTPNSMFSPESCLFEKLLTTYHRIRIALYQIQDDMLSSSGQQIIHAIIEFMNHQTEFSCESLPNEVENHIRKWCEKYPELSSKLSLTQVI